MAITHAVAPTPPVSLEDPIEPNIPAALQGDARAFAELYDEHAARVYALCLRMLADPVTAAELVPTIFQRIWDQRDRFRGDSQFSTWLHRVAVNEVLQHLRGERRRTARIALMDDGHRPLAEPHARTTDPGFEIDMERALSRLPAVPRHVFVLHDIEGYSHEEIAQVLTMPASTSRSHLFRARRALREELS